MVKKYNKKQNFPSDDIGEKSLNLSKSKWHTILINPRLLSNKRGSLYLNHQNVSGSYFYISYLEENLNFSTPPNSDCGIYPGKTYLIDFQGEVSNTVHAELFLIYYKQQTKVKVESFEINHPSSVIIDNDIEQIRVALRISGKGTSFINNIKFSEVSNNIKSRPINEATSKNEVTWESFLTSSEILNGPWYWKKNNYINNLIYSKEVLNTSALFPKNESQYISYGEENTDFSQKPLIFNKELNPNYRYEISFKGQKSDTSMVYLFLIFYSGDGKKEQVETFSLNESRSIRILEGIKFFRIALKISGEGSIQVNEIMIKRRLNNHLSYPSTSKNSNLILPSNLKKLKTAVICDTFTMNCLQPECELIIFSPDNWKEILTLNPPHILFVESAWEGNHGKWTKKVAFNNKASIIDLLELIDWCKQNKIPTIFWNKEDPVHFNSFIKTAQHFDYIFTTDQASIENYKKRVKHDNVYSLPFAAQPSIHNPIETHERKQGICFAGSYYANQYIKRQGDMQVLFEAAAEHGLTIYDRNYGKQLPEFYFPQSLRKYVKGNLPPDRIDIAYKGYKIALNVNSVVHSPTMFSRRVFECLACNTPVVSTYSKGIENIFKDIVFMGQTKEDFNKEFNKLLKNDFYYSKRAHLGLRNVLEKHTYEKRLRYILKKVNIKIEEEHPRIQVYSIVKNLKELNYILNMYMKQNYKFKHLIVIMLQPFDYSSTKEPKSQDIDFLSINDFKNELKNKNFDYFSYFDKNNFYGPNFLNDMYLATKYSNSDIIGKGSYYEYSSGTFTLKNQKNSYTYVNDLYIDTALLTQEVFFHLEKEDLFKLSTKQHSLQNFFKKGYKLFSIDPYNFVKNINFNSITAIDDKINF